MANVNHTVQWDEVGQRFYETGVTKTVLYPMVNSGYPKGTAWNGVTSVSESPSGAEATALWADDIKYLTLYSNEDFGATIEAYTYPDEFKACDGSKELAPGVYIGQQNRQSFGLCYRTTLGNDTEGNDYAYILHIIYGAKAAPSQRQYSSINDSPEAATLSWELTTTPVAVSVNGVAAKPIAHMELNSKIIGEKGMIAIENVLYGNADNYELLAESPDDWSTKYMTYFTKESNGSYKAVQASSGHAPEFAASTYYKNAPIEGRLPLPNEIADIINEAISKE